MPISWSQVTITLLPASLSLVRIPRSRLPQLSHPVLRQILQPNPTFLNITCNEVELSLFAEDHMFEDFEPISRRDRHKQRSRSGSGSKDKDKDKDKNVTNNGVEPVEVSYEKWNVLQIDSHSDQVDDSGARVSELSAPLAAAGISILYQSSYMSDFIFVKESRLQETMSLFAAAGFDVYSSDTNVLAPHLASPGDDSSICDSGLPISDTASLRHQSSSETLISPVVLAVTNPPTKESEEQVQDENSRTKPPTSGEVHVLSSDLACVGLSDELGVDHWGLKIVKLVAFPDLIPFPSPRKTQNPAEYPPSQAHLPEILSPVSAYVPHGRSTYSSSSSSSSSDDDGYFSHSPVNLSVPSPLSSASRSCSDLTKVTSISSSSKHRISTLPTLSPIKIKDPHLTILTDPSTLSRGETKFRVPFFSFTRTPEGSSLTTDVTLLATLFPPHERHMVICGGELDAVDDRINNGAESCSAEEGKEQGPDSQGCTLKCLQIDLRRFGLDKHGLVNRFSRVLEDNGINHMYSSTFKTANLLVDKMHALRAQALLRTC